MNKNEFLVSKMSYFKLLFSPNLSINNVYEQHSE